METKVHGVLIDTETPILKVSVYSNGQYHDGAWGSYAEIKEWLESHSYPLPTDMR